MSLNSMTTLGALRQTCDRCRKLKVRCQRDNANLELSQNITASATCVRCSRANVACAYSRKTISRYFMYRVCDSGADLMKAPQRCGRPPVATYGRHTWSISKPARKRKQPHSLPDQHTSSNPSPTTTAFPPAPQACTDFSMDTLESWFDGSSLPSIGGYVAPHAQDQDWTRAFAGTDCLQQAASSSPETWECFDTDQKYNDFDNSITEAEKLAVACAQRDEAAITAADIKELADLHIGIHSMAIEDTGLIPYYTSHAVFSEDHRQGCTTD